MAFAAMVLWAGSAYADGVCTWQEWGGSDRHEGELCRPAQDANRELASSLFDPFVEQEIEGAGALFIHYQVPLNDALDNVYMMAKSGTYTGPFDVSQQVWSEKAYRWKGGKLKELWTFASDWKPEIFTNFFEPMFQPALWGPFIYIPGAGGTVWQVLAPLGIPIRRINPFGEIDPNRYVSGAVTTDALGNIYWNVVRFDADRTFQSDEGWLVKASVLGPVHKVSTVGLVPGAPATTDQCLNLFPPGLPAYPPPPNPDGTPATPDTFDCGIQRPGYNMTPAIGADGTIYFGTTADFNPMYSYLVALRPNLSLKWATSLRGLVHDGCGVLLSCPPYAEPGVDPWTNQQPELTVDDASSSTPVVLPDGNLLYGALDFYNGGMGHLVELDGHDGHFLASYTFGWDVTPAVWRHDGTYSIILKDNHYAQGNFYVVQLSPDLTIEWTYKNQSVDDEHPTGFEWCVNAPAVDSEGNVYLTSEDGSQYTIGQGGIVKSTFFLSINDGAAYTPLSLDRKGRVYALANGVMTVLGN